MLFSYMWKMKASCVTPIYHITQLLSNNTQITKKLKACGFTALKRSDIISEQVFSISKFQHSSNTVTVAELSWLGKLYFKSSVQMTFHVHFFIMCHQLHLDHLTFLLFASHITEYHIYSYIIYISYTHRIQFYYYY